MDQLFNILWTVIIWGAIFGILWWGKSQIAPALAEPFASILHWVLVAAIVVVSIGILIGRIPIIPFLQFGSVG